MNVHTMNSVPCDISTGCKSVLIFTKKWHKVKDDESSLSKFAYCLSTF